MNQPVNRSIVNLLFALLDKNEGLLLAKVDTSGKILLKNKGFDAVLAEDGAGEPLTLDKVFTNEHSQPFSLAQVVAGQDLMLRSFRNSMQHRVQVYPDDDGFLLLGETVDHTMPREREQMSFLCSELVNITSELSHVSVELEKARQRIDELLTKDPLTGVANRKYFTERLEVEISRSRRSGSPLSLVMADIDHLKVINESHGHDHGDKVLSDVGRLLSDSCRKQDLPARYGGEEFVVMLPDSKKEQAVFFAERVRRGTSALETLGERNRVTCSLGATQLTPDDGLISFLRRAEEALLEAKRSGRNQVSSIE